MVTLSAQPDMFWVTAGLLAGVAALIYGRSIPNTFAGDDWSFLLLARLGPGHVFAWGGNYHYNPLPLGLTYVIYLLFGVQPAPYHLVALFLFAVCAVLVMKLAWRLTGSLVVGMLAGFLFVTNGRPYEAVIWGVVALFQLLGLVLYLGGMLFYLDACDRRLSSRRRRWAVGEFAACVVLVTFTYEQETTLIVACALYGLIVAGAKRPWHYTRAEFGQRVGEWARVFGLPAAYMLCYLGAKFWLANHTGVSQTPGLSAGVGAAMPSAALGLIQAFVPGIAAPWLIPLQKNLYLWLFSGYPLYIHWHRVLVPFLLLAVFIAFARPFYRYLATWTVLIVISTALGIGYMASRYTLLFIVPSTILWAALLVALTRNVRAVAGRLLQRPCLPTLERMVRVASMAPAVIVVTVYVVFGVQYALVEQASWKHAAAIEQTIVARVRLFARAHPDARTLYLVNLPDRLPSPVYGESDIYVCRNGGGIMVELLMPGRFATVVPVSTPTYVYTSFPQYAPAQLDAWSRQPDVLMLVYDANAATLTAWDATHPG